tara:strand:- start:326 stop:706 length:381 start_codon:yes stop_codon:yes gene_type:complete
MDDLMGRMGAPMGWTSASPGAPGSATAGDVVAGVTHPARAAVPSPAPVVRKSLRRMSATPSQIADDSLCEQMMPGQVTLLRGLETDRNLPEACSVTPVFCRRKSSPSTPCLSVASMPDRIKEEADT